MFIFHVITPLILYHFLQNNNSILPKVSLLNNLVTKYVPFLYQNHPFWSYININIYMLLYKNNNDILYYITDYV
nr:MAG TPA: hypothetical protein [Caudoviricetes sp.]